MRQAGLAERTIVVDAEAAASAAGKSECAAGKSESIQHTAQQQLSLELQRVRAMASSSVPFSVDALAELLVDDYARLGFARGSHVKVLEIVPGGPMEGGCLIKVALGASGIVGYQEKDGLRSLPARPAAVPEPLAQPVSRPPQTEEPLLYFLRDPSRLICLRLVRSSELGRLACNVVDAMLSIVRLSRKDIKRVDTYQDTCPILERLHSKGIWQSETWSAVASIKFFDGSMLSAVGLGSNKETRDRAVHLSLATALTLELLKGCPADLLAAMHQVMHDFPLLAALVKEARQIKERTDEELLPPPPLPPTPTNEECYDFARQFMVFHENPNLWFSVGRIGGENV